MWLPSNVAMNARSKTNRQSIEYCEMFYNSVNNLPSHHPAIPSFIVPPVYTVDMSIYFFFTGNPSAYPPPLPIQKIFKWKIYRPHFRLFASLKIPCIWKNDIFNFTLTLLLFTLWYTTIKHKTHREKFSVLPSTAVAIFPWRFK